jgi:hypothetical protein
MLREVAGDPVRTARFFAGMAGTARTEPAKPDMASLIRWMKQSRPVGSMS